MELPAFADRYALGPVSLTSRDNPFLPGQGGFGMQGGPDLDEATSQLVDGEVRRILDACYDDAVRLLHEHGRQLEALAKAPLDRETLDEQEMLNVTGLPRAPRLERLPIPAGRDGSAAGLPSLGMRPGAHPS